VDAATPRHPAPRAEPRAAVGARARGWVAALGVGVLLLACRSAPSRGWTADPGPNDALSDRNRERVAAACEDWALGRLSVAHVGLRLVLAEVPRNLALASRVQDLELEMLAERLPIEDLEAAIALDPELEARGETSAEQLRRWYRARAETDPSPAAFVLAARLEPDLPSARALLEEALALDPDCVWAHYGLAHTAFRAGEYRSAEDHLASALEIDPGHLPSRRLETLMLARRADEELAIDALELWIERARREALTAPSALLDAELDLAILAARAGDRKRVEELCRALVDEGGDAASALLVLAATRAAAGDLEGADAAIDRALELEPEGTLPRVHRALVAEARGVDAATARAVWTDVVEQARGSALEGLAGPGARSRPEPVSTREVLFWLRARIRLERLEAAERGGE